MTRLYPTGAADSHVSPTLPPDISAARSPLELRLSHQERNRLAVARHIDKDPEAYRARCRDRERRRYAEDPVYREAHFQRKVLHAAIDAIKKGRRLGYRDQLGYNSSCLKQHMEARFQPGWTWENHGTAWQVDHIRPVTEMVREGITDPSIVSALSNLRPVSAFDNNSKGSRPAPTEPTYARPREEFTGEKHHLAKLTEADVRIIKARLLEGKHGVVSQLAREYGVANNTIQQIKTGKAWREVEPGRAQAPGRQAQEEREP